MMHPTTVAVDLAKTVFELAIADRRWRITGRRRFFRRRFARFLATERAAARAYGHAVAAGVCQPLRVPQQDGPHRCRRAARGRAVGGHSERPGEAHRATSPRGGATGCARSGSRRARRVSIPCADSCESTASCGQSDEPALLDRADTSPSAYLSQILASVHADVRDAVGEYPCWPGGHTSPHTGQIYDCRRSTGHVPADHPLVRRMASSR